MFSLFTSGNYTIWFPQKAKELMGDGVQVAVTTKPKFKVRNSCTVFLTKEEDRFLYVPENGFKLNEKAHKDIAEALAPYGDFILSMWEKNGWEMKLK